jgi:hypothetical protein
MSRHRLFFSLRSISLLDIIIGIIQQGIWEDLVVGSDILLALLFSSRLILLFQVELFLSHARI